MGLTSNHLSATPGGEIVFVRHMWRTNASCPPWLTEKRMRAVGGTYRFLCAADGLQSRFVRQARRTNRLFEARVATVGAPPEAYLEWSDIGVARHLNEALKDYDGEDTEGALVNISVELPKLLDHRNRAVAVFTDRGVTDLMGEVEKCVALLEDLKIRAEFINKLRLFYETLNILEHRPEVPPDVFRDAKLLGFINKVAANLYRDPALNLLGVDAAGICPAGREREIAQQLVALAKENHEYLTAT